MSAPARRQYDHRIRHAIVKTGDRDLFPKLAIPDSTRRSWLSRGVSEVVTLDARDSVVVALHADVARLEKRVAILAAVVRLLVTLARVSGMTLSGARVPSAVGKRRALYAVTRAEPAIGRSAALRVMGLTGGGGRHPSGPKAGQTFLHVGGILGEGARDPRRGPPPLRAERWADFLARWRDPRGC